MFGYKINQDDFAQYIEKMNNNELTVEDILDQDSIVRDLKTNSSSEFVSFLTNQNMKKLIDYVTKMPNEDDQKIGHKFPFNASEILCSNNMKIINKYFNEKNESEKSENDEEKNEDESKIEESENDDLLNYLFNFLNSESNDMNYVLIGYFNKIINHLLQNKSTELLNYIFNLHQEIFEGLIKHLNRRAIGETIKNILIYNEDNVNDLNLQRKKLIISIIQELNENQDEEKCFCICETIINCISNKEFFVLFMLEKDLVSLLYSIIYKNIENDKNLRTLLHLMIKINEKILSLFDNLVTPNLGAENENVLNYDNDFDNNDNNEKNENIVCLPKYWNDSESIRFLQASEYKIPNTIKLIKETIKFNESYYPFQINIRIKYILNSGLMYLCGKDKKFRPIIIIQAKKTSNLLSEEYKIEEIQEAIIYFLNYIIKYHLIPGQIENWVFISDLFDVGISELGNFKKILDIFNKFRGRVYRNFLIRMGKFLKYSLKGILNLVGSSSLKKIKILDKDEIYNNLNEIINPNIIPKIYGGLADNSFTEEKIIFPPNLPKINIINDLPNEILSEEEYKIKCLESNDKPYIICPTLKKKWNKKERKKK